MIDNEICEKLTALYTKAWDAISNDPVVMAEIERARNLNPANATAKDFLREYAWTVCGAGFNAKILSGLFLRLEIAFKGWDYEAILRDKEAVRASALQIFHHAGKIDAILKAAEFLHKHGWDSVKAHLLEGMIITANGNILPSVSCLDWLKDAKTKKELPWLGDTLRLYLLKNLGFDMAKNDIWLTRAVVKYGIQLGYKSDAPGVQRFVEDMAECVGERTSVVETVLWNASRIGAI